MTERIELPALGGDPRLRWTTANEVISQSAETPEGRLLATIGVFEGDLWLVEGDFR